MSRVFRVPRRRALAGFWIFEVGCLGRVDQGFGWVSAFDFRVWG